jgi:hypothetical protein
MGSPDPKGECHLVKEMIRRGGSNIYSKILQECTDAEGIALLNAGSMIPSASKHISYSLL